MPTVVDACEVAPVRQAAWEANVIDLDRALAAYLEDWEENPNAALRAALSDLLLAIPGIRVVRLCARTGPPAAEQRHDEGRRPG
jgi:hypothetical protein